MVPRERICSILEGKTPDYVPLFPKISFATSQFVPGMTMLDYMGDPKAMAQALLNGARTFDYDAVGITVGICNEGMPLGSQYERLVDAPPKLVSYLMEDVSEYERIGLPDPNQVEPLCTIIGATRELRKQAGDELLITAWVNGPLNTASQLLPLEDLLCGMLDNPESTHAMLQRCTDFGCRCAKAMIEAGADGISIGHATASCTVISPAAYQEFALPYEKQLIDTIHQAGGIAITHICGNILPIAEYIAQNGSEIIDCDHMCDMAQVYAKTGKVVRGNVDPALLAKGTPEQVYEAARRLMEENKDTKRFILGTGCEVNLGTPSENLKALAAARRDLGAY